MDFGRAWLSNRRSFLMRAATLWSAATPAVFAETKNRPPVISMYLAESGTCLSNEAGYVVGVLTVKNRERHLQKIRAIRARTGFQPILKYRNRDQAKVPFASAVIDYVFSTPDIVFTAFAYRSETGKPSGGQAQRTAVFQARCEQLVKVVPGVNGATLYAKKYVRASLAPTLKAVQPRLPFLDVDPKDHEFMDIAEFFAGNLYGELRPVSNRLKTHLIGLLRRRCGVSQLQDSKALQFNVRLV